VADGRLRAPRDARGLRGGPGARLALVPGAPRGRPRRGAERGAQCDRGARLDARDLLVVTQNVDDLHERAGLGPERLVHVHGQILESRCVECDAVAAAADDDEVRPCARCGAGLRPGVVWFGERLPAAEVARVERWLARGACDLALVVGTTASFGYLVDWVERAAGERGAIVDVDPGASGLARELGPRVVHRRERAGEALPRLVAGARARG